MYGMESFSNSKYYNSVLKVREFMFNDIDKTLKLADNKQIGAPNFLLALGLVCYTEYWGKLLEGIEKSDQKSGAKAFNAFLKRLDCKYYGNLLNCDVNLYGEVRCGLAHAYLIEGKGDSVINTGYDGIHGIDYDQTSMKYIFWIRTYFDEFKYAVNHYIDGLDTGNENLQKLEDSLDGRPELI